ncbi:uncharacterized protein LOC124225162 isoform X2 [Equus quagga]|uniref:uncharacterized protein LOC124225162 isoform X2 n=1 Tax=Equus quagga TaxID=89248 RepID=UPI001EE355F2|nr:uncharacterized protein LOC124225162 isoform X2 [Equus quagga]
MYQPGSCAGAGGKAPSGWVVRAGSPEAAARPGEKREAGAEARAGAASQLGLGREDAASRRQRAPGAAVRLAGAARAGAERRGEARRGGERERRRPLPRLAGSGGGRRFTSRLQCFCPGEVEEDPLSGWYFGVPRRFCALTRGVWPFLQNPLWTRPPSVPGERCGSSRGSPRRRRPRTRRSGSRPCRRPGSRSPRWCCPRWPSSCS